MKITQTKKESHGHITWFFIVFVLFIFVSAIFLFNRGKPKPVFDKIPNEQRNGRVYTVFYTSGLFSPTNLQINVGDTVRFKNDSLSSIRLISDPHPEHDELPGLDSISNVPSQGLFSYTFVVRGIFGYHNEKNPNQQGTIIVK